MNSQSVCHLSSAHKANDTRIYYKECRGAAAAGFQVYYVVTGSTTHDADGVHIVNAGPYRKSRLMRMTLSSWQVCRSARKLKAGLYHFHDPELLPAGFFLKILGHQVVYDVHEDVAADILDKTWISAWLRKPVASIFDALEKFVARRLSAVITVTEEIAARFSGCKKVVLLRNFPVMGLIDSVTAAPRRGQLFTVVYSGMITRNRGILSLVKAMDQAGKEASLILIGSWEDEALQNECRALPGYQHVQYLGQVSQEVSLAEIKAADAGIISFLPIPNHVTALPNKPFEYMACGLPMIMSAFENWKRMFDGCALFVDPGDATSIAGSILALVRDRTLARRLGEQGFRRSRELYSWEAESKKLTNLYNELLKN
jgi:glycosyltransferase involved in cell wall biosynthesis